MDMAAHRYAWATAGTGGKVLFGNDSHGIARNPNISTFTDVNDVVMFTAGSGSGS
jgi:hypothetical protein